MKTIAGIALALALAGCTTTTYVDPQSGAKFSRTSFLNTQSVGLVEVPGKLRIEGYTNQQAEVVSAAVAAAVRSSKSP